MRGFLRLSGYPQAGREPRVTVRPRTFPVKLPSNFVGYTDSVPARTFAKSVCRTGEYCKRSFRVGRWPEIFDRPGPAVEPATLADAGCAVLADNGIVIAFCRIIEDARYKELLFIS